LALNWHGFRWAPTVSLGSALSGYDALAAFAAQGTVQVTSGAFAPSHISYALTDDTTSTSSVSTVTPEEHWSVRDGTIIQYATTGTATSGVGEAEIGLQHIPVVRNTSTGTFNWSDIIGLRSAPTISAAASGTTTVTNRYGVVVADVTKAAAGGTETVTNNYGVDIRALSSGTTNIGLRNADTTVYTPTTQTIAAASDTISPTASLVCLNSTANRDLSSTPHISDGVDGQVLTVMNCDTGSETIELNDQANVANSGLQLAANSDVTLNPGQSITLVYTSAGGASDWFEISRTAQFQSIASMVIKSDVTQVNYFCGPGFDCNATETNVDVQVPTDITVVGLTCEQKDDTTCTVVYTVRDDAAGTAATCTTTNADVCNWNGTVSVAANSLLAIQLTSWTSCTNNSDIECAITYRRP
jgi:hypothetical protein